MPVHGTVQFTIASATQRLFQTIGTFPSEEGLLVEQIHCSSDGLCHDIPFSQTVAIGVIRLPSFSKLFLPLKHDTWTECAYPSCNS